MQTEPAERKRRPGRGRAELQGAGHGARGNSEEMSSMQLKEKLAGERGRRAEEGRGRDGSRRKEARSRRAASEGGEQAKWRVHQLEREKLELTSSYNQELTRLQAELTRLRSSVERGEAQRVELHYQLSLSCRDAGRASELTERVEELQQTVQELQRALLITRQAREEQQEALQQEVEERDRLVQSLGAESQRLHRLLQDHEEALEESERRMEEVQRERQKEADVNRRQENELKYLMEREEATNQRLRSVEASVEAERAAHLESKFSSEVVQLRAKDLEAALAVERSGQQEAQRSLELLRGQFRELERAYGAERGRSHGTESALQRLQAELQQCRSDLSVAVETGRKTTCDLTERLEEERRRHTHLEQGRRDAEDALRQVAETLERHSGTLAPAAKHDGNWSPAEVLQLLRTALTADRHRLETSTRQVQDLLLASETLHQENQTLRQLTSDQSRRMEEREKEEREREEREREEREREEREREEREEREREEREREEREREEREREEREEREREEREEREREEREREEREKEEREREERKKEEREREEREREERKKEEREREEREREERKKEEREREEREKEEREREERKKEEREREEREREERKKEEREREEREREERKKEEREIEERKEEEREKEEERLSFLHCVYQRLLAGCVLLERPQSMLGSFTWEELRDVIEEQVEQLTGELRRATDQIALLQGVCEKKSVCVRRLQRTHECVLSRHTHTVTQLQSELQVCRSQCASLRDHASSLELRLSSLTSDLSRSRRKSSSFLSACALLAGALTHSRRRLQALCVQKAVVSSRLAEREELEEELRRLAGALEGEEEEKGRSAVRRWRRSVWAVVAVRRWSALVRQTTVWFQVEVGGGGPPVCVCGGVATRDALSSDEDDSVRRGRFARWLRSERFAAAVLSSMSDLQGALAHTGSSHPDVMAASRSALSRLLDHLLDHLGTPSCPALPPPPPTVKPLVASLQQHFLLLSQRLHSAEVERRSLRLEVTDLKRGRREREETVPAERFHRVWAELQESLSREQEAQTLIQDQRLTEARQEVSRKERSLRILGKHLSGVQRERKQLEERLRRVEDERRDADGRRHRLIGAMKEAETRCKEVSDALLQSHRSPAAEPRPLPLPDLSGAESIMGAPEVSAWQSLAAAIARLHHACSSRMAWLEQEVSAHRSHATALRGELQDVCLRDNLSYVPVSQTLQPLSDSSKEPSITLSPAPSPPPRRKPSKKNKGGRR